MRSLAFTGCYELYSTWAAQPPLGKQVFLSRYLWIQGYSLNFGCFYQFFAITCLLPYRDSRFLPNETDQIFVSL